MAEVWPSNLPQFVLRGGYQEGFKDLFIRSSMSTGNAKRRRRFSDGPEARSFPIEFTSDELDTFKTFLYDTLAGGALSFTKEDPRTGDTETYAFTKIPDPATPTGYNTYIVTLPLEKLQ